MTAFNSGIIYLENFVESTNLLPADLARSLCYIRSLDERLVGAPLPCTQTVLEIQSHCTQVQRF